MPETIETFVSKLQQDGVEQGKKQAEQIVADARTEADRIVDDARKEADRIRAEADKDAANTLERSKSELQLAARDLVLRLRDALTGALEQVIQAGAGKTLEDVDWLGKTLHDIVMLYAKSDLEGTNELRIRVEPEVRDQLVDWAIREIGQQKVDETREHIRLDLKGTLNQAGFEYTAQGATVEVTISSVAESLRELIAPALREMIDQAVESVQQDKE